MADHDTCSKTDLSEYKVLIDQAFEFRDKAFETFKVNNDNNLKDARDTVDRRLAELSDLRKMVVQDRSDFLRIDVYDSKHDILTNQANALDKRLTNLEATLTGRRAGFEQSWALFVALATIILSLIYIILNLKKS